MERRKLVDKHDELMKLFEAELVAVYEEQKNLALYKAYFPEWVRRRDWDKFSHNAEELRQQNEEIASLILWLKRGLML